LLRISHNNDSVGLDTTPYPRINNLRDEEEVAVKRNCETRGPKYLTQAQVKAFFAAIPRENVRDRLLFGLIYRLALRASEAVSLPTEALDRRAWTITVQGAKNGLRNTYTVPQELRTLLRRWQPKGATLLDGREGALSREYVWQLFQKYARAAGIPKGFGAHSLRHSACTHAFEAGLDIGLVRDLARHRNIASTMVYAQVTPRARAEYLDRLQRSSSVVKP
jgi:site-specific recombinase XerD